MNKYTAEQVAREADLQEDRVADMLRDYAALLRECELAKAAVTDGMVDRACEASFAAEGHSFSNAAPENKTTWRKCIRAALEANLSMLASARTALSQDQIERHQLEAGSCPPQSKVLLVSSIQRMLASARVPDGWQLVPVEATDEMCEAAWESDASDYVGEHRRIHRADLAYKAMLAAAPKPETEE